MTVKITKLTAMNVEALNLMAPKVTGLVEVTKTTATFIGVTAYEALRMVAQMQDLAADTYGKTGAPYASLHAVVRKVNALAFAEQANEDRMRAESATVEATRDSGALAEGLAAAKARSEARSEADAASDPLVTLLNNTVPKSDAQVEQEIDDAFAELADLERRHATVVALKRSQAADIVPAGARVHAAVSDAAIVKAMADVMRQVGAGAAAFETWFAVQPARSGRVAGRLLAASKSGQRRPRRGRRG